MSKVAIQGNASGSGVLTIAAPNTNTNRTITLPDATGTLALAGGASDKIEEGDSKVEVTDTGSNGTIVFNTDNAERMRIDSGGRALIGATSTFFNTDGKLYLAGDSNSNNGGLYVSRFQNTSGGSPSIQIFKSRGASIGSMTTVQNADELGAIVLRGSDGTNFIVSALIGAEVDGTVASNQVPGRLLFYTASSAGSVTERARITSGGFFKASNAGSYVNATGNFHEIRSDQTNVATLISNSNASTPFVATFRFTGVTPNNTTSWFLACDDATNDKAFIYSNGSFQSRANSYGGISDVKLKQDIVNANSQWDDIKGLRVVKYRFKDEVAADPNYPSHLGVIAQEAELVSPGLVFESPDFQKVEAPVFDDEGNPVLDEEGNPQVTTERVATGTVTKGVKYSVLYMKAVKALQEAIERIETLEAKVAALENNNA